MAHRPELIVIGSPTARLRPTDAGGIAAEYADVSDLDSLFQPEEHRFEALHPEIDHETLSRHFRVVAPEDRLEELAERLAGHRDIRAAYVKPAGSPPIADAKLVLLDLDHPDVAEPPSDPTPDYLSRQGYLEDAPIGVGALSAWNLAGGRGQGVNIIDCEFGWNFAHEDLQQNTTGLIHGTNIDNDEWVQHGTAVLGIFGGDPNQIGVTGICPEATVSGAAFGKSSARTIRWAADQLQPGDILLIELERTLNNDSGQSPFSPVEWWPDDFEVIRYAVGKGVIVVEAAANGNANLDDAIYDQAQQGFPDDWKNPLRAGGPDSGAILVGAGCPPSGTHGRTEVPSGDHAGELYVDRARCGFSNYGSRVDAQGWGWEVTTTGYGGLKPRHKDRDRWYMDRFNGTSSALPVVVGALACVQGVLRAKGLSPLTPAGARDVLRRTGSPQQAAPNRPTTQRIGNRPDIRAILRDAGVPT
jgi:hypothetical protein